MEMSERNLFVSKIINDFLNATMHYMEKSYNLVLAMSEMDDESRQLVVSGIVGPMPELDDWVERMAACASMGMIESKHLYGHTRVATPKQITHSSAKARIEIKDGDREFEIVKDDGTTYSRQMSDMNMRELSKCWSQSNGTISATKQREMIRKRVKHIPSPKSDLVHLKSASLVQDDAGKQYFDITISDGNTINSIELFNGAIPVSELRKLLK